MKRSRSQSNSSAAAGAKRPEAGRPAPIAAAAAAASGGSGAAPVPAQPPKKRGRPFKQKFLNIRRDDQSEEPAIKLKPAPEPAAAPPPVAARPARRVKSDVKYRNTDSEHSSDRDFEDFATANTDDDDDDDDDDGARRRKKPSPTKRKSASTAAAATVPRTPPTMPAPATAAAAAIYQCDLCPVKFKRMGWLKVHMQKQHGKLATGGSPASTAAAAAGSAPATPSPKATPPPPVAATKTPPATASKESTSSGSSSGGTKHYANILQTSGSIECRPCGLHFNRQSALQQHQRIAHTFVAGSNSGTSTGPGYHAATAFAGVAGYPSSPAPLASHSLDPFSEMLAVKAYFDSINPQHSTTIAAQLDQMFKQTNKQMQWLKRQTTLPTLEDFAAVDDVQREMLAKQLRLYDTCTQLIAAKRDSLQFAYDDWAQKHGGYHYGDDYGDEEEEEQDEQAVREAELAGEEEVIGGDGPVERVLAGRRSGGASKLLELCRAERMNGHRSYAERTAVAKESPATANGRQVEPVLEAVAVASAAVRIEDGVDFEFLDSKTGKLFSNKDDEEEVVVKAEPAEAETIKADVDVEEEDDDYLVELIEVDDEEDEDF